MVLDKSPVDSASSWLWWSNFAYIAGALLTLLGAILVYVEKKGINVGAQTGKKPVSARKHERTILITESVAVGAAAISLIGTAGAVHFGNVVSRLKDADLSTFKTSADVKIAQADAEAKSAQAMSLQTANNNLALRDRLTAHEQQEKEQERASHRVIRYATAASQSLVGFRDVHVSIDVEAGAADPRNLQQQLLDIFTAAGIRVAYSTDFGPGRFNLVMSPGVHLETNENARSIAFCKAITAILKANDIAVDQRIVPPDEPIPFPDLSVAKTAQFLEPDQAVVWIYIGPAPGTE